MLTLVLLRGSTIGEIEERVQHGVADCMARMGWSYDALSADEALGGEDLSQTFAFVKARRGHQGYGITAGRSAPANANDALFASLSADDQDRWATDLGSSGANGCRDQAEKLVYVSLPFYDPVYASLTHDFIVERQHECYEANVLEVRIRVERRILDSWVASGKLAGDFWPLQ